MAAHEANDGVVRVGWVRRVRRWIWNLLAVVGLVCIVYHTCFDVERVISGSMAPTLQGEGQPGSDIVLFEKVSYWFRQPRRWEVVRILTADHMLVAKRVAGLPGETVSLDNKRIAIDGRVVDRPDSLSFLCYLPFGNLHSGQSVACGDGYYVLGDETQDSLDSRFEGVIEPKRVRGRAWLIVWPLARFGWVNP